MKPRKHKTSIPTLPISNSLDPAAGSIQSWIDSNQSLLLLLALVCAVFSRSLMGSFVIDDIPLIRDNPHIRPGGTSLFLYFTQSFWALSALQDSSIPMFRPLVHVFNALGYKLWGGSPLGYHLALLILHLGNTGLVFTLIRRLSPASAQAALFGAALFALNPVRVESVSWISGSPDPLVLLFVLLGLLCHRSAGERGQPWRYLAALVYFQCALWSKEVAVIFPLVLIAHDLILKGGRIRWRITTAYLAITLIHLWIRSTALGSSNGLDQLSGTSFARMFDFFVGYAGLLTLPTHIPFFLTSPSHSVASMASGIGLTLLITVIGFSIITNRTNERQAGLFSIFWLLAFMWPAVILTLYSDGFFTARFLYLPAAGFSIALALCYDRLAITFTRHMKTLAASGIAITFLFAAQTWREQLAWQDNVRIYTKITEDDPDVAIGYASLGHHYLLLGSLIEAERYFRAALNKHSTAPATENTLISLGSILGMSGRIVESRQLLERALAINPASSVAWNGIGNLLWIEKRPTDAAAAYRKALEIQPSNQEARTNLASLTPP